MRKKKAAGKAPEKGKSYRSSAVKKLEKAKSYGKPGGKGKPTGGKPEKKLTLKKPVKVDLSIRLNKYLANSGICSRREADKYIEGGLVKINGEVVTTLGTKVMPGDTVHYGDERVNPEKPVYLLLNKPKDFITTMDDPQGRKTVAGLVATACKERVFPVGRLDRNTTGLLLMTNDGDLAKKLTHPKHAVKKIYHVQLDKNVSGTDLQRLVKGVHLDDGEVNADKAVFVGDGADRSQVGVELHSGKNRVIRRMFESLGYQVKKLDRVYFAGLTKKNLPRSKYRFLTNKEVNMLKMLS